VRTVFHDHLDTLTQTLGQMCGFAGVAMERAIQALLQSDLPVAEQVITDHDQLVVPQTTVENDAFTLLALQAPVASDLRMIISAMQTAADVERMGALALHVAQIARCRHPARPCPKKLSVTSPKWAGSQ
jgi:phosphate transport system protein